MTRVLFQTMALIDEDTSSSVHDLWDIQPASKDLCWNDDDAAKTRCCKVILNWQVFGHGRLRKGFIR
jgi:hypothetical protein